MFKDVQIQSQNHLLITDICCFKAKDYMKGSESFGTQEMHLPREHMNIHKLKKTIINCSFLPGVWFHQPGIREFFIAKKTAPTHLCWKLNFFSFSKLLKSNLFFFHHRRILVFTLVPFTCSCQRTFKMLSLLPWALLSAEPFPVLTQGGDSPASLETAKSISQPAGLFISLLFWHPVLMPGWQEEGWEAW